MSLHIVMPNEVKDYSALVKAYDTIRPCDFINRPSLKYLRIVLAALGNPHEMPCKRIHITGTNGKGSVTAKVAHALRQISSKVAEYATPHIDSYCERMKVNGKMISEKKLVELSNKVFAALHQTNQVLGMVGVTVCVAFLYFQEKEVEYAVIEVGIGGRDDHTNVIPPPILAAFTSIGLDHVGILGETEEEIAKVKAGIIKGNHPVVLGPRIGEGAFREIKAVADEFKAPIFIAPTPHEINYEKDNQSTALLILRTLFGTSYEPPKKSLQRTPSGRFQRISLRRKFGNRRVIFDVAHNPPGIHMLLERIKTKCVLIFGLGKGKDLDGCCKEIASFDCVRKVYLLKLDEPGLYGNDEVAKALAKYKVDVTVIKRGDLSHQLTRVGEEAKKEQDRVVISGSFKTITAISNELGIDLLSIPNLDIDTPEKSFEQRRSSSGDESAESASSYIRVRTLFHSDDEEQARAKRHKSNT